MLNGATEWAAGPIRTNDELLDFLKANRPLKRALIRSAQPPEREGGRPRDPGQWPIAYLLFVISGEPTIKRWLQKTETRIWKRCKFKKRPKYDTVHHHFVLLESFADAYREQAMSLIAHAVDKSKGLVGRDIHVDGTEAESNARAYHDCEPGQCPNGRGPSRSPVAKTPTPTAREQRQALAENEAESEQEIKTSERGRYGRGRRFQKKDGCWYWTSDEDAGLRAYTGKGGRSGRVWVGFYNMKAIDHYTGAVIAAINTPAYVNEADSYPLLLEHAIENSGKTPRAVIGDRGFGFNKVYETNTRKGIVSVFPWRKQTKGEDRRSTATAFYDEHGIPRCPTCGGEGRQTRFSPVPYPRIWFECPDGCGESSVACSKGWRHLIPLPRTSETYFALKQSHSHFEKAHWRWRDQWLVGADNPSNRPRRRGIACHELRTQAALLLEWMIVCYREGWLGGPRINQNRKNESRAIKTLRRFLRHRVNEGLHLNNAKRKKHKVEILKKAQKRNE